MISILSINVEEWILETLIHGGSVTEVLEWPILEVDNNITVAGRLSSIPWYDNCDLICCWKVEPTWITVFVDGELYENLSTVCALKELKSIFKCCSPAMILKDKVLQAMHDMLIETGVAVHFGAEGLRGSRIYKAVHIQGVLHSTGLAS